MPEPTDENYVHELPAAVFVAVTADRPQMLTPFITQVEEGTIKLNKKAQVELLKLVQGLLADRSGLEHDLTQARTRLEIVTKQNNKVLEAARRLGNALVVEDLSVFEEAE